MSVVIEKQGVVTTILAVTVVASMLRPAKAHAKS